MEVPAFYLVVDVLKLLHYVDAKYAIPKKKKMLPGTLILGETSSFKS